MLFIFNKIYYIYFFQKVYIDFKKINLEKIFKKEYLKSEKYIVREIKKKRNSKMLQLEFKKKTS